VRDWAVQKDENTLRLKANLILGAVVNGMRKEEPNGDVRMAGATAFYNALEFVEGNFNDAVCISGFSRSLFFIHLPFLFDNY
jgi:hypothetical protein